MKERYIYENDYALCPELCQEIIKLFENTPNKPDGSTLGGVNKNVKDTTDYIISKSGKWTDIYECLENELKYNIKKYKLEVDKYGNDKYSSFNDELEITPFMVQRYIQNEGKYLYHNDFHQENNKYRVVSYIFYLNDVVEGGETEYFGGEIKIKPKCGKLVFHPASWTFPHCGKMPLSSNKYIITGWIYSIFK
jgi:predicted house-cleaning noncanonical NTP pyrophosphatase (MazG superfamily)